MELDPVHRIPLVHDALYHAVAARCGHLKFGRDAFRRDRKRVISRRFEVIVQAAKHTLSGVVDTAELAVHRFRRAHDMAAIDLSNSLVPETDTEDGYPPVRLSNEIEANAGLVRRAWSRR